MKIFVDTGLMKQSAHFGWQDKDQAYEGDLEIAMVPECFRVDVLKESLDANKVLVGNANVETANFALMFEFDGDVKKIRHCLYKCAASRPTMIIKDIRKWRLRMTSTNFNELVDFGV